MQFNYSIPTCFVQRFQLEQIISDLPKSHPNIIIQTPAVISPTRDDYKNFEELVIRVKALPGSSNSPLKAIVDKLKEAAKVLRKEQSSKSEDPCDFDPTKAPGKIAHNMKPNSCYAAVLLNTLRDEFFKEKLAAHPEIQPIIECIDKINQGSKTHLIGSDKGVVSVNEIAKIQKILSDKKLIKLDGITDQDPMEVLCNLLQSICPNFSLFEGKEINHYHLQQINNPEEVILSESQLGPNGVIVVDQEGKTYKNLAGIAIPLNSPSATIHLDEALENYLDDKQPSEKSTVYVKTNKDTYLKYSGVTRQTTRTLSKLPERLFLEISGHSKKTVFKEKISLKTDDGKEHYYVLQQINCHLEVDQFKHEYAYLNHDSGWFLSDDLKPIRRAFLKVKSNDVNDICSHGRVFIYRKVDLETFKKISNTEYSFFKPMVPKEKVNFSLEPFVLTQLKGLSTICQRLASNQASLQDLFELSWGVANLPKECKFSKVWLTYISESNWLLLEDISRQLSLKYPEHPNLSNESLAQFVQPFSETAKHLGQIFESLQKNIGQTTKPIPLNKLEELFYQDFDQYILNHIQKAVKKIQESCGGQDPIEWLKANSIHVKALFRVIEIIGEASKIVSQKAKQDYVILNLSQKNDKGSLWGRLRNQLHHKKKRCWDIAKLAPQNWAIVITELFPKVLLKNEANTAPSAKDGYLENDRKILEKLFNECDKSQYDDVHKIWSKLEQSDFSGNLIQLKKLLLGFESYSEEDFEKIWETLAKPFLKSEADETRTRSQIFQLLRMGKNNHISQKDIEQLSEGNICYSRQEAIAKLKELLSSIDNDKSIDENEQLVKEFKAIADQFVFLQTDQKLAEKVHKGWELEKNHFSKEPIQLKEHLFSFKSYNDQDFEKIWQTLKNNGFLKQGVDENKIKSRILELFKLQKKALVPLRDESKNKAIKALTSSKKCAPNSVEFSKSSFAKYKEVFEIFMQLKQHHIVQGIKKMQALLDGIAAEWPNQIDEESLKISSDSKKASSQSKDVFLSLWSQLKKEEIYIITPQVDHENLLKDLSVFGKVAKSNVQAVKQKREMCLEAIARLKQFLDGIKTDLQFIKSRAEEKLKETITLFGLVEATNDVNAIKTYVNNIRTIFVNFSFPSSNKLIQDLNQAGISHQLDDRSPNLNDFRSQVENYLKAKCEQDYSKKIDELTNDAENELGIVFVQNVLQFSQIMGKSCCIDVNLHISTLRDIHNAASTNSEKQDQWENIERKLNGRHLSAKELKEVLPTSSNSHRTIMNDLIGYLNQTKGFSLDSDLPRFAHGHKKVEIFTAFLHEEFFPVYPELKSKEDLILKYFKIANRIVDSGDKTVAFAKYFTGKIEKLGNIFLEIVKDEDVPSSSSKKDILSLAAEYDMQDVGEIAQLISDRPALWDLGRDILSPYHLMHISLLRKMMAHYPLSLEPELLRWNLGYLAFDTQNVLFRNLGLSNLSLSSIKVRKRGSISFDEVSKKLFDIEYYLDQLNLSLTIDVLHPSFHSTHLEHLHWLGDFALMVYPKDEMGSKEEFIHAVMKLELILSFEFQTKVCILGKWNNDIINIPNRTSIPITLLNSIVEKKQPLRHWIFSHQVYDVFLKQPWNRVVLKSGKVIYRNHFELYKGWKFFFEMLGFKNNNSLNELLDKPDLSAHITNCLKKYLTRQNYPESELFKWICCLFERFSPPGTKPLHLICFPQPLYESRPIITMLDTAGYGLGFLPEVREDGDDSLDAYYNEEYLRMDFLEGCSLLNPSIPIDMDELEKLAVYAAEVLTFHREYIISNFQKEFALERSQFVDVSGVIIDDPSLGNKEETLNQIPEDIKVLIKSEAKSVRASIAALIQDFSKNQACQDMLDLMIVDKEIELIARKYYSENRLELLKDYIQMDPLSKKLFNECYIEPEGTLWMDFCLVSNFRMFINTIHSEAYSFKNWRAHIIRDFEFKFKKLVKDEIVQEKLLDLMKKRGKIMDKIVSLPNPIQSNKTYIEWAEFFRIIRSPGFFEFLKKNFRNFTDKKVIKELETHLENEWEMQYKIPGAERENYLVYDLSNPTSQPMQLFEPRIYFKGKLDTKKAKERHVNLMKLLKSSSYEDSFIKEWEKLYNDPIKPIYYKNLINETRILFNKVMFSIDLDSHDFDQVGGYYDYWKLVKNNDVKILTTCRSSGVTGNFKRYAIEGITFDEIEKDPEKLRILNSDKRVFALVKAFIDFNQLDNDLSNYSYHLKIQIEEYLKIQADIKMAIQLEKLSWMIPEHEKRHSSSIYCIEKACKKIEDILRKMVMTRFFEMLKFDMKIKHFQSTKGQILSEEDQVKQALDGLLDETFDLTKLIQVLQTEHIPVGALFKLFYKFK